MLLCNLLFSVFLYLIEPKPPNSKDYRDNEQLHPVPKVFPWWFRCNCGGSVAGTCCRYLTISTIEAGPIPAKHPHGKNEYYERYDNPYRKRPMLPDVLPPQTKSCSHFILLKKPTHEPHKLH